MTDGDLARVRMLLALARGRTAPAFAAQRRLWWYWAPRLYDELVSLRRMLAGRPASATITPQHPHDTGPRAERAGHT